MAMTNAERQAEWRARQRTELAKLRRLEKAGGKTAPTKPTKRERDGLPPKLKPITATQAAHLARSPELRAIIEGLETEGKKNVATISPSTVAHLGHSLKTMIGRWVTREAGSTEGADVTAARILRELEMMKQSDLTDPAWFAGQLHFQASRLNPLRFGLSSTPRPLRNKRNPTA